MILKRPYAFLVKHFRLIHAILLLCFSFLIVKSWDVISFFGSYIKNKQEVDNVNTLAETYVTSSIYIVSFIVLIICGVIIYLLRYKKKPIVFYLYIAIVDVILLGLFYFLSSFLYDFQFSLPDLRVANIVRDVFRAVTIVQIPIIIICFVRTIGFDVKKFDFKKDILDLGIQQSDNEEYEFELSYDKDVFKEKLNKKIRMFKYFYKENRFVFTAIEIVVSVVVIVSVVVFINSIEKVYKEGDTFDVGNLKIQVLESYKINSDTFGEPFNSKYFYVITKVRFTNKTNAKTTINTSNMKVSYSSDASASVNTDYSNKIKDFGVIYASQTLNPLETRDFIFAFEIPNEYYDESFKFKYLESLTYESNEMNYEYLKVKLSPTEFETEGKIVDTKQLGEELVFKDSIVGNSKLKINDIKINDNFYYKVVKCTKGNCINRTSAISAKQNDKFDLTVMRLNYDLVFDDEKLGKGYYNPDFIVDHGTIRFEINGKMHDNRIALVDVTPYMTNNYLYIVVRDKLKQADKIYLDLTLRDKVYTYIIKDSTKEENDKTEQK